MTRRLLVTSALPYANGPIHIGHLLEYVQADTWVRFMRMCAHEVHFVCADDSHGTPVMLEAEKLGTKPEELVELMRLAHLEDFTGFEVSFDNYYTTHSEENRELSENIYTKLCEAGLITERDVTQLYDPKRGQFLSDRYIRGICPSCAAPDQTGDNCENCSAVYAATDLKQPRSALSGAELELRSSKHYFFTLAKCTEFLADWLGTPDPGPGPGPRLQQQTERKLREWFTPGLQDWDISRDAPYFGFVIPGTKDKYFYVWLDAPIGYFASFKNLAARENLDFDAFLDPTSDTELYHFIGKDIINFHGLFWPAMLNAAGMRTPTRLFVHGFLTVDGAKMSKSKGTFITASSYLKQDLNPDWLRYYLLSKLNDRIEDVDLSLDDFVARVNTDLVNKLANIPSRVARILEKRFDNKLVADAPTWINLDWAELALLYERRRFGDVCRMVMAAAEEVNRKIEEAKPWEMAKDDTQTATLHQVCTAAVQAFRQLAGVLQPMAPGFAQKTQTYLNCAEFTWRELAQPLPGGHQLGRFKHLMTRLRIEQLDALVAANREVEPTATKEDNMITIDDFGKVELRVAEVIEAEKVPEADRIARLRVNIGALGERTIFAGILGDDLAALAGRKIVVCANLPPRKMRFGTSEGMCLGAPGPDGQHHFLVVPDFMPAGAQIS